MSSNPPGPPRPAEIGGVAFKSPDTYCRVTAFQSLTTFAWAGATPVSHTKTTSPVTLRSFVMIVFLYCIPRGQHVRRQGITGTGSGARLTACLTEHDPHRESLPIQESFGEGCCSRSGRFPAGCGSAQESNAGEGYALSGSPALTRMDHSRTDLTKSVHSGTLASLRRAVSMYRHAPIRAGSEPDRQRERLVLIPAEHSRASVDEFRRLARGGLPDGVSAEPQIGLSPGAINEALDAGDRPPGSAPSRGANGVVICESHGLFAPYEQRGCSIQQRVVSAR